MAKINFISLIISLSVFMNFGVYTNSAKIKPSARGGDWSFDFKLNAYDSDILILKSAQYFPIEFTFFETV